MSDPGVLIGDVDPEDAYDAGDPWDERAAVLYRVAQSIREHRNEERALFRVLSALALLARLAIERPDRAAELGDLLERLEALR